MRIYKEYKLYEVVEISELNRERKYKALIEVEFRGISPTFLTEQDVLDWIEKEGETYKDYTWQVEVSKYSY